MLKDLFFRLRSVLRRKTVESEMEEELQFHSERQFEKYLKTGMSRAEAQPRRASRGGALSRSGGNVFAAGEKL